MVARAFGERERQVWKARNVSRAGRRVESEASRVSGAGWW